MSHEPARRPASERPARAEGPLADAVFEVLADADRRIALSYLARTDGPTPVDDVVDAVVREAAGGDAGVDARGRVAAAFHHNHLPRMADAGLVDYDVERRTVAATPAGRQLEWALSGV